MARGWLYRGDKPIGFMSHNMLYLYLDQLSTTENIVDDKPSQLLAVFRAMCELFGTATPINPYPDFKRLEAGTITELNVRVTDECIKSLC